MIKRASFDVGDVLGECPGPSLGAALAQSSPRPAEQVAAVVAERLHRAPEITDHLLAVVAAELDLGTNLVREIVATPRPLRVHPQAPELIAALRRNHPGLQVVVCSNVSAADADQVATVRAALAGVVDEFVFSFEQGMAKPDPHLFAAIEDRTRAAGEEIVHVGDRSDVDVQPALRAGWRALLVHPGHEQMPAPARPRRYRSAADLPAAMAELHGWIDQSRAAARPTLPVRASVRIRDAQDRILIVRGPDDHSFSLPGGRLETFGPDHPEAAAVREAAEELGVQVQLGDLLWSGWAEAEASTGTNKILFIFDALLASEQQGVLTPDPAEVAELRWATRSECARLLHPGEAERIARIDRGDTYGAQVNRAIEEPQQQLID